MTDILRETKSGAEVPRKVLHLLVAAAPLLALEVGRPTTLAIVAPIAVLAVVADLCRSRSEGFEQWIQGVFGFMMRKTERAADGRVVINGATWVLVSFVLLLLLFPFRIATSSFFIFMIADAVAALVGQSLGKRCWPWSERTIEGTAAFIFAGVLAAVVFPGLAVTTALPAVIVGAAAEVPRGPFNDNLRVPVVIGLVMAATGLLSP